MIQNSKYWMGPNIVAARGLKSPLGHPVRASLPADSPTGPAVGDRLPDFSVPDAFGRIVNFHEDRGVSKAALVFYRSAVW